MVTCFYQALRFDPYIFWQIGRQGAGLIIAKKAVAWVPAHICTTERKWPKKKMEVFTSQCFILSRVPSQLYLCFIYPSLPSCIRPGQGRWGTVDGRLPVAQFRKQLLTFGSHLSADSVYTCLSSSVPYVSMHNQFQWSIALLLSLLLWM